MKMLVKEDVLTIFRRSCELFNMIGHFDVEDYYEIPENIVTYYINAIHAFKDSQFYDYPMLNYLFEIYQLFMMFLHRKEIKPSNHLYTINDKHYLALLSIHADFIIDLGDESSLFDEDYLCNPIYLDPKDTISEKFDEYMRFEA